MVKCGGAPPVMALCVLTQSWAYWSCSGTETLTLINTLMKLLQPQGFRHQWHFMWVTRHRHQWHLHTLHWAGITWAAVTAFVVSITLSAANSGSTHCVCLPSVTASVVFVLCSQPLLFSLYLLPLGLMRKHSIYDQINVPLQNKGSTQPSLQCLNDIKA